MGAAHWRSARGFVTALLSFLAAPQGLRGNLWFGPLASGGDFAHRPRPAALGRVRKAGEAARTSGEDFTPWPRPAALGWVRKAGEAARTSGEDVAPWPRPAALGWVRKAGEAARVFAVVL